VPAITTTGIARIVSFGDPGLFPAFGLGPEYGTAAIPAGFAGLSL